MNWIDHQLRLFSALRHPTHELARRQALRARANYLGGIKVEDLVLGANDGIITTFAVVAGATGGNLGPLVILVLGFANLFADSVSMGASNYLGKRSKRDYIRSQREMEDWEIEHTPDQEKEEVRRIFQEKGLQGEQLESVVNAIIANKSAWLDVMMTLELGLAENNGTPIKHGLATSLAFMVAGIVPLLPYLFISIETKCFLVSAVMTVVTLFIVGALRTLITGVNWIRSGLEMLGVGSAASVVAYIVGRAINTIS